ncbi:MAG: PKD domain-containing protein [Flavobacteriales bacterium]|nr:PKD domain-containing protein [Flavobacteriales bacterium]
MKHRFTSFACAALALASLSIPTWAQNWHTVGTGTASNGPNGVPCPFGDIYAGQRAQYIYLASELTAAGLSVNDTIVRVRWVVTALNGSGMHENYTIRVGHTSAMSLSGLLATPTGASTTPVDYQPVVGNNDFTLHSPFIWNGTSNLLVEVTHFSPTYGTATANASVAFTSTAPVKRSFSLLDDLMWRTDQTVPFAGEVLNSTGLPNIVLGVAQPCAGLVASDLSLCTGDAVPPGQGLSVEGCTESLGGQFTASFNFPNTNLACTGSNYVLRSTLNLPELPSGAVVQAGRLILTSVMAEDPVWLSDLYLKLSGSIEGEIQLMPGFDEYSGTVPELMITINGPYEPGPAQLLTRSTYGTGYIGSARVEFDYLLSTPIWYDAAEGGNMVAYGEGTIDPVALGLASTATEGTTLLHVDCGVASTACTGQRAPVAFNVVAAPEPAFSVVGEPVVAGIPASFSNNSNGAGNYAWDFGDGTASTETAPQHTWSMPGTYTVTLTMDNGTCATEATEQVVVEVNTGLCPTSPDHLRVFGTQEGIVVERTFGTGPIQVELMDAVGRTVYNQKLEGGKGSMLVPFGHPAAGLWLVRVTTGDVQRTFRMSLVR